MIRSLFILLVLAAPALTCDPPQQFRQAPMQGFAVPPGYRLVPIQAQGYGQMRAAPMAGYGASASVNVMVQQQRGAALPILPFRRGLAVGAGMAGGAIVRAGGGRAAAACAT